MTTTHTHIWSRRHTLILLLLTLVMLILAWQSNPSSVWDKANVSSCTSYLATQGQLASGMNAVEEDAKASCNSLSLPWTWIPTMLTILVFTLVAGHGVTGRWAGFLIDPRNKMSLARLQLVGWSVIVIGAYLVIVMTRVWQPNINISEVLDVTIPSTVWMLLGISMTSSAGSALILNEKKHKAPDSDERNQTLQALATVNAFTRDTGVTENSGVVVVNDRPQKARFADMFRGDETGNAAHLDLSKVQMFFFTLVTMMVYFVALTSGFVSMTLVQAASFPVIEDSMVVLLGISHAGYLGHKLVPHSKPA